LDEKLPKGREEDRERLCEGEELRVALEETSHTAGNLNFLEKKFLGGKKEVRNWRRQVRST